MMKSNPENYIEEINTLINNLGITGSDATELINIYFEFFAEDWTYIDFLRNEIRIIKDTKENQPLIAELESIDDACLFEGDDYVMLTNYQTLINMDEIGDCLPNHSF